MPHAGARAGGEVRESDRTLSPRGTSARTRPRPSQKEPPLLDKMLLHKCSKRSFAMGREAPGRPELRHQWHFVGTTRATTETPPKSHHNPVSYTHLRAHETSAHL
eukprot:15444258-Alexandrium_andersonii.AAC.1